MKISHRGSLHLSDFYPGSQHVHTCDLGSANDSAIWAYAQTHGFVIVSKGSDFAEMSVLQRNPPKVIWIRVGNCSTGAIEELFHSAVDEILHFVETANETCLVLTHK
jgi:predicted nuclease of predicted toxin-antitoxin system